MYFQKRIINKVLLLTPPAFTFKDNFDINPVPPLGLAYIAAVLEEHNIEVKIVDCLVEGWGNREDVDKNLIRVGLDFIEIETVIRKFAPDVVGVSSSFSRQYVNASKIYNLTKKIDKNIVIVTGGAHPTVLPELVLNDTNVDFVVIGEGEYTFRDLIEVLKGQKEISSLDGIGFKDDGHLRIIPKTSYIENLDELPFPARHLLNMEKYYGLRASHGLRKRERFTSIITSRGCPASCTFCSARQVWGKKFRYRSPENVINEMKLLKEKFGIEELMFEDDNITLNIERSSKLFDLMIQEKFDFIWDTPNGVAAYSLTEDLIDKMKKSGCYRINLAIETGNQYVMDNIIKKPLNLEKVKPLIKYMQKIKIDIGIFLIMGMPGETEEQMWDSFRFVRNLEVYYPHISIATPYPGSELYKTCIEKNYFSEPFSLDSLYIRSFMISTKNWDGKKLKQIFKNAQRYFFFSFLIDHPIQFLKHYIPKLLFNPLYTIKRAVSILSDKK